MEQEKRKGINDDLEWCRDGRRGDLHTTLRQGSAPSLLIPQALAVPKHPSPSFSSAHASWILSPPPLASVITYLMTAFKFVSQTLNSLLSSE